MKEIYLVVELCSLPGDSSINAYGTKAKAVTKFESLLEDDLIEFKEEILEESECETMEEFGAKVKRDLSYAFRDDCSGLIWVTEVRKEEVDE